MIYFEFIASVQTFVYTMPNAANIATSTMPTIFKAEKDFLPFKLSPFSYYKKKVCQRRNSRVCLIHKGRFIRVFTEFYTKLPGDLLY